MTTIQIRSIGNYLEVNEQGYLQSRADAANITGDWRKAVELLINVYLKAWGQDVHSIYVRGSLAKGVAIKSVSDIDSFAVLRPDKVQTVSYDEFGVWAREAESEIQRVFPFVAGVEVGLEWLCTKSLQKVIKTR